MSEKASPKALVLCPTRELANQIYEESRKFAYQTGLRPLVIYGGAPSVFQVSSERCHALAVSEGLQCDGWLWFQADIFTDC